MKRSPGGGDRGDPGVGKICSPYKGVDRSPLFITERETEDNKHQLSAAVGI